MTPDELTGAIECAIKNNFNTIEGHTEDHEFIEILKKERKDRRAMWQKIKGNVIGWFIITVLGAIGTVTYQFFSGK